MKKKNRNKSTPPIPSPAPKAESTEQTDGICEDVSEIPESLAEDICEAIEEAKDKEEERREKHGKHEMMSLRNVLIATAFAIILYYVLNHTRGIFAFLGSALDVVSPIIAGGCIAFILNLVLVPLERLWGLCFSKITDGKKRSDGKDSAVQRVIKRLKRPVCLILSTLIMFGLVLGLFFIVIPELTVTVRMFIDRIPSTVAKTEELVSALSEFLAKYRITLPEFNLDVNSVMDFLNSQLTQNGKQMLNSTVGFTASLFSTVFDVVLSIVFALYILAQKEKLGRKLRKILYAALREDTADTVINVAALSGSTFTKFVTGQFTEAIIIGVLCYIGMLIFGLPYAAVISVVIGATAIIPMFGAFIGAGIGAVLILAVSFKEALWFVIFIIVLQQLESNLIYPRVVGKSIGLPGLLVLTSVTVGGAVFGFAGILLGVPVCSVFYCIFNEFVAMRLKAKSERVRKKSEE